LSTGAHVVHITAKQVISRRVVGRINTTANSTKIKNTRGKTCKKGCEYANFLCSCQCCRGSLLTSGRSENRRKSCRYLRESRELIQLKQYLIRGEIPLNPCLHTAPPCPCRNLFIRQNSFRNQSAIELHNQFRKYVKTFNFNEIMNFTNVKNCTQKKSGCT